MKYKHFTVYVKGRFATQPISKPASWFQSGLACFKMGRPVSKWAGPIYNQPVKSNGLLWNRLGGQLRNQLGQGGWLQNWLGQGGRLRILLVNTNAVVTYIRYLEFTCPYVTFQNTSVHEKQCVKKIFVVKYFYQETWWQNFFAQIIWNWNKREQK